MIAKKKKVEQKNKNANIARLNLTGLFLAKASRERLLEELKRGTLFHFTHQKEDQDMRRTSDKLQEDQSWINQIKVDSDRETAPRQQLKSTKQSHSLQASKHFPAIPIKQHCKLKNIGESRCDKVTCFQKKLKKIAAWNKQNSNGIDNNISRLATTLQCNRQDLVRNDFSRTVGANFKERTLDQSIMSMNNHSIYQANPFSNLSFACPDREKHCSFKLWKSMRKKRICQSEGPFVPAFLMTSLIVEKRSNSKDK